MAEAPALPPAIPPLSPSVVLIPASPSPDYSPDAPPRFMWPPPPRMFWKMTMQEIRERRVKLRHLRENPHGEAQDFGRELEERRASSGFYER